MRAEPHLVVVHRKMRHAAAEFEQFLAGVTVARVLLDGVLDRLLGEAVLQLERGDRQTVDEQPEVERALGLVAAVAELARDREAVLRVACRGDGVAGRRRAVEECDVMGPVLDPFAEHVDDTAFANLALKAGQELPARRASVFQAEPLERLRLRVDEEGQQLRQIDRVLTVVVVGGTTDPAGPTGGGCGVAFRTVAPTRHRRDCRSGRCRSAVRGRVRWCRSSHLGLLWHSVEVVGGLVLAIGEGIGLVERFRFFDLVRQPRRRLAHVELPGDHVGDQAGAVFARRAISRCAVTADSTVLRRLPPSPLTNLSCSSTLGGRGSPNLRCPSQSSELPSCCHRVVTDR